MNHFKHAQAELERANQILTDLCQAAVALGLSERGLNTNNAALFCFKALEDYRDLKQLATELGTTLPKVVQSYRMRNHGEELIPTELRFAPSHWVREATIRKEEYWANGNRKCRVYREKAVSAATAQRLRVGLQQQLIALFTMIGEIGWSEAEKQEYTLGLIESYKRDSYEVFSSQLAKELWELSTDSDAEPVEDTREDEQADDTKTPDKIMAASA